MARRQAGPRQRTLPRASWSWSFVVLLVAALTLGACSFTTDTAATVGSERITIGEFNAALAQVRGAVTAANWQANEPAIRRGVMDQLVATRLVRLEARRNKIVISDAELRDAERRQLFSLGQSLEERRQQMLQSLAGSAAQYLRPLINDAGGASIPDADLIALMRGQIDQLQSALDARGPAFTGDLPSSIVRDRASGIANELAAKGVTAPAEQLAPVVELIARQLMTSRGDLGQTFQQDLFAKQYFTTGAYRHGLRQELLEQKLRPLYIRQVDAITLQQLITDNQDKAREALAKGRAGTPFAELVKQYAVEGARSDQVVNNIGSVVPAFFTADVQKIFPSYNEGAYSEVTPVRGPSGGVFYRFFHVTKSERRDPTPDEAGGLREVWLDTLRVQYPVMENPALKLPPRVQ